MKKLMTILTLMAKGGLFYGIILFCISFENLNSQTSTRGTDFWLGYMENLNLLSNGPPAFQVVITSDENTNGKISIPLKNFEMSFNVNAGEAKLIELPA